MRKGLSVALAASGLLVSGSAFAVLDLSQPGDSFGSADWALLVQLVAAIATAVAAVAACVAASHSSNQSNELKEHNRWQRYLEHQEQFISMLREIERYMGVHFQGSTEFYNELFPDNRHLDREFSFNGDQTVLTDIRRGIEHLFSGRRFISNSNLQGGELNKWLVELTGFSQHKLWLAYVGMGDQCFSVGGEILNFGRDKYRDALYIAHYAAYRILNFCNASEGFKEYKHDKHFDAMLVSALEPEKSKGSQG